MKSKYKNILIILLVSTFVYEALTGHFGRYLLSRRLARSSEYRSQCCLALKTLQPNIKNELFKQGALFYRKRISVLENEQFTNIKNKNEHEVFHDILGSLSSDHIFIKYYEHNSELFVILVSSWTERVLILQEDGSILFRYLNREMNNLEFSDQIYTLTKCNNFLKFKDMIRNYDYK